MNQTPTQRTIIFGSSLATLLVVAVLVLTGGRKPAPAQVPAPAGEAALPMLDGVNGANPTEHAPKPLNEKKATPSQAESKHASEVPLNN